MNALRSLSRSDLEQVLTTVGAIGECEDVPALRDRILNEMSGLLATDSITYNEIDLDSGQARWWTDPPEVGARADADAFATFLHQHPIAAHHERHGGAEAVQLDDFLSRRELHRLDIYGEFYRPLEVEHQIAIAIDAPGKTLIPISAQRRRGVFPERTRTILELLHPHLSRAYREIEMRRQADRMLAALAEANGPTPMLLNAKGRIEMATGGARRLLHRYFGAPSPLGDRLPEELKSWLASVRAGPGSRAPRTLHVRRGASTLEIRFLPGRAEGEADALLLEERSALPRLEDLRALGLTKREAGVLECAARGATDAEIAEQLVLSIRTVQKHLQNIYRKLGVHTRTAAVARALGHNPDDGASAGEA